MRQFGYALAAGLLIAASYAPPSSAADTAYEVENTSERPLMVIRFNEPHLRYEKQLYNTISMALQAKPSAVFDIVSVAPKARNADDQDRYNQVTAQNTHKVMGTLQSMGLPQSRLNLTTAQDAVQASEVRIFVR